MLKVIFGFLGLLIALAIVSSLAKNQLGAIGKIGQFGQTGTRVQTPSGSDGSATGGSTGSMAGKAVGGARLDGFAATAGADMPTAQQQIQGVQQSARDRTNAALQQGVQRNQRAQP